MLITTVNSPNKSNSWLFFHKFTLNLIDSDRLNNVPARRGLHFGVSMFLSTNTSTPDCNTGTQASSPTPTLQLFVKNSVTVDTQ